MKLQIEKQIYGGAGLARQVDGADTGKAVFVPFVLRGEVVEARLTSEKDGYSEAALVEVIEASTERLAPGCVHFGECGGCQYQHARYGAQMEMKRQILLDTLGRAGLEGLPEVEVHTGEAWGYRNRIRFRVAEVDGASRVGYSERRTANFLPISECLIAAPVLWRAAEAVLTLARRDRATAAWVRAAAELEFFGTADESKVQMTLFMRKDRVAGFAEFCETLRELLPELVGAGVAILPADAGRQERRNERAKDGVSWGVAGLGYEAVGRRYWVSRGGFFQVNRFLIEELVAGCDGGARWSVGLGLVCRGGIVFASAGGGVCARGGSGGW